MRREPLALIATCDLVATVRGRAVAARALEKHLTAGVGWVPADLSLHPFGGIVDPNPFGSVGDLRLIPDAAARCRVDLGGATPLDVVLADLHEPDGTPWSACPRLLLRQTLADLEAATGLRLLVAFEHEFTLDTGAPTGPPFSLEALRAIEPFGSEVMAALEDAGLAPTMVVPEYGVGQFEVPCAPAIGVAAADRAVHLREVIREMARQAGWRASFAPLAHPERVGNGVHVHISLVDGAGRPAMRDGDALSAAAGSFAAGILRHARALVAMTAPTPASMVRLQPHRWTAGFAALADADREALLRIPTPTTIGGQDAEEQLRFEYRAADATACPHLVLAALALAGLAGIRDGLPAPAILRPDAGGPSADQLAAVAPAQLPSTLAEALDALEADAVAATWLPPLLREAYLGIKRWEVAQAEDETPAATCARYAAVY